MRTLNRGGRGNRHCRWLAVAAATAPFLVLPALAAAPSAAAAAEVDYFGPEPATVLTMAMFAGGDEEELSGVLCQSPRTCRAVPFPYLERSVGTEDLNDAIQGDASGQPLIVFGYSQGARVASQWLEEHAGAADAPSPDQLSFVLIGNPSRKHGGAHVIWGQITPDTQYQVLDVARQYDLAADRPDHPNLLALMNAYAGLVQLHGHYEDVDIYAPTNYVWTEGNTTYVLVPTENLPILEGLRKLGLNDLADKLNGPMKAKIEQAYDRSYLPATPGWPAEPEPQPAVPPPGDSGTDQPAPALSFAKAAANNPVPDLPATDVQNDAAQGVDGSSSGGDPAPVDTEQSPSESTSDSTDATTGDNALGDGADATAGDAADSDAADSDAAGLSVVDDNEPATPASQAGQDSSSSSTASSTHATTSKHRNIFKHARVAHSD
jgi:hypothetical protein